MTGACLSVCREGKWQSIEIEHLTDEEREEILEDDPELIKWLNLVCERLIHCEKILDSLVEEGIVLELYGGGAGR